MVYEVSLTIVLFNYMLLQNMAADNLTRSYIYVPVEVFPACTPLPDNEYVRIYSCNMAAETGWMGLCSLGLTILNIFCIIIMAIIVLKVSKLLLIEVCS